jgi:ribosomal-protein-alanine N-acetyltransferase
MKALLRRTWSRIRPSAPPAQPLPVEPEPQIDSVRIRAMQLEDLPGVHAIDELSFSMPWPLSSYRFELLENPASMLWVAEASRQDGKKELVGMVVVWMLVDEAHIATIAVHPDYRGRGIGRQLLLRSLQETVQQGAVQATLEVRVGNLSAQNLYRQFGFRVVGRRPKYYQDNYEDALIMTMEHLSQEMLARLEREKSTSVETQVLASSSKPSLKGGAYESDSSPG